MVLCAWGDVVFDVDEESESDYWGCVECGEVGAVCFEYGGGEGDGGGGGEADA